MAERGHCRRLLVVDGGQSSTVALIATVDGDVLGYGVGGPVNHVAARYGRQRMWDALSAAVGGACRNADTPVTSVELAYLGLTGGVQLSTELLPEILPSERIVAESDAVAALASGTYGEPGVGVIAGTGVVAVGLTASGHRLIRGGWGYQVGDAGSGYWIGMEAVRAAARAEDGIVERGPLYEAVLTHFGVCDVREIAAKLYAELIERPKCAQLAPAVLALSRDGDPLASDIIGRGIDALEELVVTTARAVGTPPPGHRVAVLAGGLMRPAGVVASSLAPRLGGLLTGWRVMVAEQPPVIGGLYLALRAIGRPVDDEVRARVDASLERFGQLRTKNTDDVIGAERNSPLEPA